MFLLRGQTFLLLLLITTSFTCIRCDDGSSSKESEPKSSVSDSNNPKNSGESLLNEGQDSFSKKQGLIGGGDVPDQLAIESNHEPVEHRGEGPQRPIPVPVSVKAFPNSLVLPMPPGFSGGPPLGNNQGFIRMPGPPGPHKFRGPQGQHSVPHPNFFPPPQHSGELKFTKSKEVYSGGPPPSHHQSHLAHQQIHEGVKQQVHQHFHAQQGPSIPKIMVPPRESDKNNGPIRGDQGAPKPHHSYQGQDAQLANSVFRELFEREQQKIKHHGGPPKPINAPHSSISGHKVISSNDLTAAGGQFPAPSVQYGPEGGAPSGPWPQGPDSDMPKIVSLEVKCEKSVMRVYIAFDKPFFGVIFSKGHYHNVHCIHLPAGLGHTSANFDIGTDACGTQGNTENGLYGYGQQSGSGSFFENIIVIQYDPQVQEVWDQARKLRCTWHDQYEKSVTFRPFPVDMLDVVRADFAGDNVGCWMQIQVGKGPWASEVSGLVKIGQSMTMVLAIKDDDNKFDMLVRNCMAHDGVRAPIQLVDQWGCVTRPKLMSRFTKIKNFGQSASVLSYAHFQAFKFPDSMEVHFQCTIQICRYQCPEQCTQPNDNGGGYGGHIGKSGLAISEREEAAAARRRRRALNETDIFEFSTTFKVPTGDEEDVGVNRVITVVSDGDLDFLNERNENDQQHESVQLVEALQIPSDVICMSTFGFSAMLIVLIGTLLIACIFSAIIVLSRPRKY